MKTKIPSARRAGFTLIELVISAGLMSLVLVSAYLCLHSAFASQKLIESRSDALQNARVALELMSADLRSACSLSTNFDLLGMRRSIGEIPADNLDFATHNYQPRRAAEADWCAVSYFLDKGKTPGGFSLWRRRDLKPDADPLGGGGREEIATNVRGLRFDYFDGLKWYETWGDPQGRGRKQASARDDYNLYGMPEAVRITVWIEASNRHAKTNATPAEPEPPLVFQTVARLNLAAAALRTGSGSAGRDSSSEQQSSNPQPGGPL